MPVYNEQEIIGEVVRSVYAKIINKIPDSEFIIVNDCSTDNTLKVLKKLSKEFKKIRIITPEKNGGHGKAIRLGFLNARKDWIFHIDSDNEYDPAEYWKLDKLREKYDIILGHRKSRNDPLHRLVLTRVARLINFLLFGSLIKDTNSAFKLINRKAAQHIISVLPEDAFAYSILMSMMGRNLGYNIMEIPVTHFGRKSGKRHYLGLKLAKGVIRGGTDMLSLRLTAWKLPNSEYKKAEGIKNSYGRI
ncbi:glycosyltransferase family 2 protein [Candidatus Woesearchaeota archaeon]|nr:glycosyltransferase family 2 protein [Candidatus Woesearchaeota archaeon]